ncbi:MULTISPECIES: hypothetical protein [unclassified Dyella]|uniref:hypothetical protein n=1 Tax=Dyella sp. ASV21 TaxID=2795114 RepID=UPI0018EB7322|nr:MULTISPECIES: hypothetical protein [unclassified Dyella]
MMMVTSQNSPRREEFARQSAEELIRTSEESIEPGVVMRWARHAGFMDHLREPAVIAPAA